MLPKKRKRKESGTTKEKEKICIIHFHDCSHESPFVYMNAGEKSNERFQKLRKIAEDRQRQPASSVYRLTEICRQIPENYTEEHGYHRECYQRFTIHLDRLENTKENEDPMASSTKGISRRDRTQKKDRVIFNADCIFCRKEGPKAVKKKKTWTTEGMMDGQLSSRWLKKKMMKSC